MHTSRREFLSARFVPASTTAAPDQPVVVSVFLRGGADMLNLVVPYGDDAYYRVRPTIGIAPPNTAKQTAIDLDGFLGFHPALSAIEPLWREGSLAIVQGVGTDNPTGSHFETQDQMERGERFGRPIGSGWLGRFVSATAVQPASPFSALGIGTALQEALRGAGSASSVTSVDEMRLAVPDQISAPVATALANLYRRESPLLASTATETLSLLAHVTQVPGIDDPSVSGFADSEFSKGLREIARLILANVGLRVACIDLNGWDTHFLQGASEGLQASLASDLATGLSAFYAALGRRGDLVTTIVMTEFGRRIYENSSGGTDHGRGYSMLVVGGGVNGGKVYGDYPGLEVDESIAGPGGLRPLIDYRAVLAEVLTGTAGLARVASVFPDLSFKPLGLFSKAA